MEISTQAAKIDPDVPFRATTRHFHRTWAGTFRSFPSHYVQPQTIEELQKVVKIASRCKRRICLVGCGHSPSDLTCTSQILVNLDYLDSILDIDASTGVVKMEAGIRLHDLGRKLKDSGLSLPNLGSIDHQSIAGAIATSTHGSSLRHGTISQNIIHLKIMLSDGSVVDCSKDQNLDLFRAALVSLGALGIIVEVTFKAVPMFHIEWEQMLLPLNEILQDWDGNLWKTAEWTRVWWMPYTKRGIRWRANKTDKPIQRRRGNRLFEFLSYHAYQSALYVATYIPSLVPTIERIVSLIHYGSKGDGSKTKGTEEGHQGLLMDCLYSQFVNEWAIPLSRGKEAITRLSAWLNGEEGSDIPFDSKGIYVHAPIEVRVSDTTKADPKPCFDFTMPNEPTLFLNATLYRPYHRDPYAWRRYYEAFEYLMKEMGGRPHWAKNFVSVTREDIMSMYGSEYTTWLRVRNEVDSAGMFVGDWHRRLLLDGDTLPLEERERETIGTSGDIDWYGEMASERACIGQSQSEESFDMIQESEDEKIRLIDHEG